MVNQPSQINSKRGQIIVIPLYPPPTPTFNNNNNNNLFYIARNPNYKFALSALRAVTNIK